jgi:DNA-directed RNA polymerase sigma subunit (sigma70/sigma32)
MSYQQQLEKTRQIDMSLAVIDIVREPGVPITSRVIAEICGCSHTAIQDIERRALQKLRQKLSHDHPIHLHLTEA